MVFLLQAFGVFGLYQIHAFIDYLRSKLSQSHFELLFRTLAITVTVAAIIVGGALTFLGSIQIITIKLKYYMQIHKYLWYILCNHTGL